MTDTLGKWVDSLRAKADAATPGPWFNDSFGFICKSVRADPGFDNDPFIVQGWNKHEDDFPNREANLNFIAATNPDPVRLLCDVVEEAEGGHRQGWCEDGPMGCMEDCDLCRAINRLREYVTEERA